MPRIEPRDASLIPSRASRRWGRFRIVTHGVIHRPDGSHAFAVPADYVVVMLVARSGDDQRVFVPVPDAAIDDAYFDLWRWVLPRANRAHRAGRLVAPLPRRWPPLAQPPPDAVP